MRSTCRDIMTANPTTLHPDQTLYEALAAVHHSGKRYLSVVDENGYFVGIFSSMNLLRALLPRSISINMGRKMVDLNFMKTNVEELQEMLDKIGHEPVKDHLINRKIPTCSPDDSIMEAIFLLHQHHAHVIVAEEDSQRFLGIISINGLLDHVKPQST
ncbi:CBS domain-containing protein [Suttonella sp. R2A3]|uniref:CBS domain-containing protein n=1 Tax=Suttonella sp. R2A3 TaxID=2908648 RepID=UPI001F2E785D|nr:CBS domain-containing protein [Suttonella sp. R2A3]UJF23999.1 CBS domain-containing protein [Suttonella sp. R2A3]